MTTRGRGERGASLVLALAFLSLFGVFIVALLAFAETSFRATVGVHEQAATSYAASGAIDTAIQRIRSDLNLGRALGGSPCDLSYPAIGDAPAVSVVCTPQPSSGLLRPGVDSPANAILTLTKGGNGIDVIGHNTLHVNGNIFSNSGIDLTGQGGSILDDPNGAVTARGNCSPTPVNGTTPPWATADLRCNFGGTDTDGDDPGYGSRVGELASSGYQLNPTPTCPGNNASATLTYHPGYYTDYFVGNSHQNLFADPPSTPCGSSAIYFEPGAYYIDLDFNAPGMEKWSMGDVVGGQPKAPFDPTKNKPTAWPASGAKTSRNCLTVGDAGWTDGVQLILGGGTQLVVPGDAHVELCGKPGTAESNVTIYGLAAPTADVSGPFALKPTAIPAPVMAPAGAFTFTLPSTDTNWFDIGESPTPLAADSLLHSTGPNPLTSASIALTGFNQSTVPLDRLITHVDLKISHREENSVDLSTQQIVVTPGGAAACAALNVTTNGALTFGSPQVFDVTSCLNTPAKLAGARVAYSASLRSGNRTSTLHLDGIELDVTYRGLRGQACGSSRCAVVFPVGNGNRPDFHSWGTLYTPEADIGDLELKNNANVLFARGVIVNKLTVTLNGSSPQESPFQLIGAGRSVELIANVGGARKVRALVQYIDSGSQPGRITKVSKWSVTR